MAQPDADNPQPALWRKGHLRDENTSSRCSFLGVFLFASVTEIPVKTNLSISGLGEKAMVQRVITGMPSMVFTCSSPALLKEQSRQLAGMGASDLAAQIVKLNVTLDVCRFCPFWEASRATGLTEEE